MENVRAKILAAWYANQTREQNRSISFLKRNGFKDAGAFGPNDDVTVMMKKDNGPTSYFIAHIASDGSVNGFKVESFLKNIPQNAYEHDFPHRLNVKAASELVRIAKSLVSELKHNNPIDQWLDDNGWTETHGIGLYTNRNSQLVGVDTNSGKAAVTVYKSQSDVFNDEGSLVKYTDNINELKKAVSEGSVIAQLFTVLSKKYPTYKSLLPTSTISFFGKDVSFTVYTDTWTVKVGGGANEWREIVRKMPPNVSSIVKFIEDAQKEILAGGGSK